MSMGAIGAYQLTGVIARGGAGVVYRARDPQARRDVAIKVLLAGQNANPAQLERFDRESVALARLKHPNVVAIHTSGRHRGSPYLVMDLVEGESLWDRLRRQGPLAGPEVAQVGLGLAEALQHAHDQGILHRDLKPHNVLLEQDGRPRLTDFGLALVVDSSQGALTKTGVLMGTPGFLPPEQAFGEGDVGPPADVYGLGATLYTALTGVPPHGADDITTFLAALATAEPTPPHEFCPVDPALEAIVLKCLRKDPEQRYATATAVAEDLASFAKGQGSGALREQEGQQQRRRTQRIAALTATALALLGAWAWSQRAPSGVTAPMLASTTPNDPLPLATPADDPAEDVDEEEWEDDWEEEVDSEEPQGYGDVKDKALAAVAENQEAGLLDMAQNLIQNNDAMGLYQGRKERKRAWNLFTKKLDAAGALERFDAALELDPNSAAGWARRGLVLYALGDVEEATRSLNRAARMDANDEAAFQFRGLVRAEEGEFDKALEDLTRAVELRREDEDLWMQRARVRLALEDYEGALTDVRKAVKKGETGQWPHAVSARANLALGNMEEALADCERAGKASPWGAAARAAIHRAEGKLVEAVQAWGQAVARIPANFQPKHRDSRRFESRLFQRHMFRLLVADLEAVRDAVPPGKQRHQRLSALLDECRAIQASSPVFSVWPRE
jgi:tetratricopeptide (TPR) repeat protein